MVVPEAINLKIEQDSTRKYKPILYYEKGDCWICFSHCKDKDGYPKIKRNNKTLRMSRYIYEMLIGNLGDNLLVMHTCDNPECINPKHFILGTQKENVADAMKKGRMALGEKNTSAKLHKEDISEIRKDKRTSREIAKDYGVHYSTICNVKSFKNWNPLG